MGVLSGFSGEINCNRFGLLISVKVKKERFFPVKTGF